MSIFTQVINEFSQKVSERDSFTFRRDNYLAQANERIRKALVSLDENERLKYTNYHRYKCRDIGLNEMIQNIQQEMEDRLRRGDF